MPVCVERSDQGRGRRGNCAWRRHHDRWRTGGGGTPHKKDITKVRDQEASDREDPDLGKSGGILNRVIEWDRDGITIEADHSATPCAVERRDERGARNDESKGENQWGWGQTQTKQYWNNVNDGGDRDRPTADGR